jgi:hypothetical protein
MVGTGFSSTAIILDANVSRLSPGGLTPLIRNIRERQDRVSPCGPLRRRRQWENRRTYLSGLARGGKFFALNSMLLNLRHGSRYIQK